MLHTNVATYMHTYRIRICWWVAVFCSVPWVISMYVLTVPCTHLDMEKFPLRMKDNDLLITQLFEDPLKEPITSLSVYLTPNVCKWMRIVCVGVVVITNWSVRQRSIHPFMDCGNCCNEVTCLNVAFIVIVTCLKFGFFLYHNTVLIS